MFSISLQAMQIGSIVSLVILALLTYRGLRASVRTPRAIGAMLVLGALAIGFEYVSIRYGIPYGFFTYSDALGQKVLGTVPWTVFFGWTPLVIGAVAIADRAVRGRQRQLLFAALLLVVFDLVFDPVAVALGFWAWNTPGPYYGVPFINFVGWFVTGYIGSFVLTRIVPGMFSKQAMIPFILLLISSIIMTLLLGFTTPLYIGIGLLVVLILIMMH
jgi:putative membrane protein